jgi:hypothetical protein
MKPSCEEKNKTSAPAKNSENYALNTHQRINHSWEFLSERQMTYIMSSVETNRTILLLPMVMMTPSFYMCVSYSNVELTLDLKITMMSPGQKHS